MAAMAAARVIVEQEDKFSIAPVKGATTIHQGALVVMDNGLAVPGRTAAALVAIGLAQETVINPGVDGAQKVNTKRGVFKFFNFGADAVTAADIGKDCFIVDDQTVAKTSNANARSVAGKVINVEGDGVFARVGY